MPFTIPNLSTRIESERLYLRPYDAGDTQLYCSISLHNRQHLQKYEADNATNRIRNEEDAAHVLSGFEADWVKGQAFFLGAFTQERNEFAAQIYVGVPTRDLPEFEVGFIADVDHEGRGYVSEAVRAVLSWLFHDLGAHRVRLACDDTNERSFRVAERCGFVCEGHIRQNHPWPDGSITGTLHFGLLCSEYQG